MSSPALAISDTGSGTGWSDATTLLGRRLGEAREHVLEPMTCEPIRSSLRELDDIYRECSRPGWDGYDAVPVTREALDEARRLLHALPGHCPIPAISPGTQGEIGFEWYVAKGRSLLVTVWGRWQLVYSAQFGRGASSRGVEPFFGAFPEQIALLVKRLGMHERRTR